MKKVKVSNSKSLKKVRVSKYDSLEKFTLAFNLYSREHTSFTIHYEKFEGSS